MMALFLRELRAGRTTLVVAALLTAAAYALVLHTEWFWRENAQDDVFHRAAPALHTLMIMLLVERVAGRESRNGGRRMVALLPVRVTTVFGAKLAATLVLSAVAGLIVHGIWKAGFLLFPTERIHIVEDPWLTLGVLRWQALLVGSGLLAALIVPTGAGALALSVLITLGVWLGGQLAMEGWLQHEGVSLHHFYELAATTQWSVAAVLAGSAFAVCVFGRLHLRSGRRAMRVGSVALLVLASPFVARGAAAYADWTDLSLERDDLELHGMTSCERHVLLFLARSDHASRTAASRLILLDLESGGVTDVGKRLAVAAASGREIEIREYRPLEPSSSSPIFATRLEDGQLVPLVPTDGPLAARRRESYRSLSRGELAAPFDVVLDIEGARKGGRPRWDVIERDVETGERVRRVTTLEELVRARRVLTRSGRHLVLMTKENSGSIIVDVVTGTQHRVPGVLWTSRLDTLGHVSPDDRHVILTDLGSGRNVVELATGEIVHVIPGIVHDLEWVDERTVLYLTPKSVEAVDIDTGKRETHFRLR